MKALVIQKKKIGDVLTSTVIFEALKEKLLQTEMENQKLKEQIAELTKVADVKKAEVGVQVEIKDSIKNLSQ